MRTALPLLGSAPEPPPGAPAWLAKGFRPFFLLAGGFAALILPLWLLALAGVVHVDAYLGAMYWHAHEMVFGFAIAVIAGFLLTAVGNWTGRETAVGRSLLVLVALWVIGRAAFLAEAVLPPAAIACADLAFLPALAVVIGRALVAAGNRRNYPVLGIVTVLWLADLAIHLDANGIIAGWPWRASLVAIDLVTLLIVFISPRIFPMFTRNATKVESIRNLPAVDRATVAAMAALTIVDLALPGHRAGTVLAGATAVLALVRSLPWGARHTARHPLLWILHVGHAWVIIGLGLRAASEITSKVPASAMVHALTVGAIGCTTLGMMARVSLGHSGRLLVASAPVAVAFGVLTLAAVVRVLGPFWLPIYPLALYVSGALWTVAFVLFTAAHARMLVEPRVDGRPG
ncbi:MAG TPA: NnrS family protein [Kofleriaceae bacterium]|nr:NnrS family protein [Kofleriaceae bacterium]